MKRTIIIPLLLALSSCTTVKKDDHSYTYIHNFNNNGGGDTPVSTKRPKVRKEIEPDNDAPFYSKGFGANSETMGDQQYVQTNAYTPNIEGTQTAQASIVHNHYYAENSVERPSYNIPPAYSGRYEAFNPAGRRFLMRAEFINGN